MCVTGSVWAPSEGGGMEIPDKTPSSIRAKTPAQGSRRYKMEAPFFGLPLLFPPTAGGKGRRKGLGGWVPLVTLIINSPSMFTGAAH